MTKYPSPKYPKYPSKQHELRGTLNLAFTLTLNLAFTLTLNLAFTLTLNLAFTLTLNLAFTLTFNLAFTQNELTIISTQSVMKFKCNQWNYYTMSKLLINSIILPEKITRSHKWNFYIRNNAVNTIILIYMGNVLQTFI